MLRCYFNLGLILDQRKASGVRGRESSRICGETTPRGFIFVVMCWTLPTTPRSQVVHPRGIFSARVAHERGSSCQGSPCVFDPGVLHLWGIESGSSQRPLL